ncbi:hypothetical protein TNCV_3141051 [Trichonephila clavipes]|nr:hypothetical protein TNCV_3141051 [Trichonephila clavipes]
MKKTRKLLKHHREEQKCLGEASENKLYFLMIINMALKALMATNSIGKTYGRSIKNASVGSTYVGKQGKLMGEKVRKVGRMRVLGLSKGVPPPKYYGGPPVDRDRFNGHPECRVRGISVRRIEKRLCLNPGKNLAFKITVWKECEMLAHVVALSRIHTSKYDVMS